MESGKEGAFLEHLEGYHYFGWCITRGKHYYGWITGWRITLFVKMFNMISLLLNLIGQSRIIGTLIGAGIMIPSPVCYPTGLLPNLPLISFLKMVQRTRCAGVK